MMKLLRDKTKEDTYMCQKVLNMLRRDELRKDHPQQRQSEQWDTTIRDGFIGSVIKMEDCDSIKICEELTENGVILWVIDGLQRITTLDAYKNNMFKLGNNVEFPIIEYQVIKKDEDGRNVRNEDGELIYEVQSFDLRGKKYCDLPEQLRENFDNYALKVVKHLDCTPEQIGYHIRRYNHQCSMNVSQNAITYMDSIAKDIKELARHEFFKNYLSIGARKKKKGITEKVVIESIMFLFHFDNWKKSAKQMGMYLNTNLTSKDVEMFENYLNRLSSIVDDNTKVLFTEKNALLWFMLFHRFTEMELEDHNFGSFLNEFVRSLHCKAIDGMTFDEIDANKTTKSVSVLTEKMTILEKLMRDYLDTDPDSDENKTEELDEETELYIEEFCESDLMEMTDLDDDTKKVVALETLKIAQNDFDNAILYSESAKEWLLEVKDYDKLPLEYAIPSVVGFVDWVYDKDFSDVQGVQWLNEYVENDKFTYDIQHNINGLIAQCNYI